MEYKPIFNYDITMVKFLTVDIYGWRKRQAVCLREKPDFGQLMIIPVYNNAPNKQATKNIFSTLLKIIKTKIDFVRGKKLIKTEKDYKIE